MNSTTNQPNLLELAKQGNAKAIAALINRQLQPKGITVKAALKDDCLQVTAESAQVPNQQAFVEFIRKGLTNISPKSIKRVEVHGKRINTEFPAWSVKFEIGTDGNRTNTLEKSEEKTDSSLSETKTTENSKEKPRSKSFVLESTGNKKLDFILATTVIALGSAISIALGWGNSQATAPSSMTPPVESPKPPRCQLAAGYIWADIRLYRDKDCQKPFASVVSANGEKVLIRFDTGEIETKTRDAVKYQAYVMSNDPAIP